MAGTATKGFTAKGATLGIDVTNGNTFVTVQQIKSLTWTAAKWSTEDVTCLSSPQTGAGVIKEFTPTLVDPGSMTAQGIYLPSDSGLAALSTSFAAGNVAAFQVQLPPDTASGQSSTGNKFTFSGYVDEQPLPDGLSTDKIINYKISVKLNTLPVVTMGS